RRSSKKSASRCSRATYHPLWRAEQLDSMWGSRRALFESRSEARFVCLARSSCAVATSSQAAQGHPVKTGRDSWGGLLWVTFLGRARKVTSRRAAPGLAAGMPMKSIKNKKYEDALEGLHAELIELQHWIIANNERVAVIFEGRDAAGKGGVIKAIEAPLNNRYVRTVALPKPDERERSQWYFERYASHLPSAGELVLFDRSWYNRAGVEPVMGFCTPAQHKQFLKDCPVFERLITKDGLILLKY